MVDPFTAALKLLGSHAKLDRDKGALSFKVALQKNKINKETSQEEFDKLQNY